MRAAAAAQLALDAALLVRALPADAGRQREMLGTVVYGLLGGGSCLGIHPEVVRRLTGDEHLEASFAHSWDSYALGPQTRALLGCARNLTLQPGMVEQADVDALRQAGLDEETIWEATALVGFYNMLGRLELAAGVPPNEIPAWPCSRSQSTTAAATRRCERRGDGTRHTRF